LDLSNVAIHVEIVVAAAVRIPERKTRDLLTAISQGLGGQAFFGIVFS